MPSRFSRGLPRFYITLTAPFKVYTEGEYIGQVLRSDNNQRWYFIPLRRLTFADPFCRLDRWPGTGFATKREAVRDHLLHATSVTGRRPFPLWLIGMLEDDLDRRIEDLSRKVEVTVTVTPAAGIPQQSTAPQTSGPVGPPRLPGVVRTRQTRTSEAVLIPAPVDGRTMHHYQSWVETQRPVQVGYDSAIIDGQRYLVISWVTEGPREEFSE